MLNFLSNMRENFRASNGNVSWMMILTYLVVSLVPLALLSYGLVVSTSLVWQVVLGGAAVTSVAISLVQAGSAGHWQFSQMLAKNIAFTTGVSTVVCGIFGCATGYTPVALLAMSWLFIVLTAGVVATAITEKKGTVTAMMLAAAVWTVAAAATCCFEAVGIVLQPWLQTALITIGWSGLVVVLFFMASLLWKARNEDAEAKPYTLCGMLFLYSSALMITQALLNELGIALAIPFVWGIVVSLVCVVVWSVALAVAWIWRRIFA